MLRAWDSAGVMSHGNVRTAALGTMSAADHPLAGTLPSVLVTDAPHAAAGALTPLYAFRDPDYSETDDARLGQARPSREGGVASAALPLTLAVGFRDAVVLDDCVAVRR